MPNRTGWGDMETTIREINKLLLRLGASKNYTGFNHTAYALYLCVRKPDYLLATTKQLFPCVAKHYGTTWSAVERNIRTIISVVWKNNRPLLDELALFPLAEKPSSTHFLAILSMSLQINVHDDVHPC